MGTFESIMLTGEMFLQGESTAPWETTFGRYADRAAAMGVTHIQVNMLPDPYHTVLLEQPDNHYAWFAAYGPSLDQFASSSLNEGVYLDALLARNRQRMKAAASIALARGLRPVLMLCEPRFAPERLLARHPHLRGPRVDNPTFSNTPWYALCTDSPEVRRHYGDMLTALMQAVPELAGISVFTSDSGSGFCHSHSLYCGPNGPSACRRIPVGQRVAGFLGCLQEAGAAVNSGFRVSLCSGLDDAEREAFIAAAPPGVTDEVQGAWSWVGGLEDQWAAHQYGSRIETVGRAQAADERRAQYRERLQAARACGLDPIAICSMPTENWFYPAVYVPHPFQNLEVLRWLHDEQVRAITFKGSLSIADHVRYDVNAAVCGAFQLDPVPTTGDTVHAIAEQWIGREHAEALTRAWHTVDAAQRTRPLWCHSFGYSQALMPGPIVPDFAALTDEAYAPFDHAALRDLDRVPGQHRLRVLRIDETERTWMLNTYRQTTLPRIAEAERLCREEAGRCRDADGKACLLEQADHIHHFGLWQRSARNWCEAGAFLAPGTGAPAPTRSMAAVIADEIETTEALAALLGDRPERLLYLGTCAELLYKKATDFVAQLRQRAAVMRAHRTDAPRPIRKLLPDGANSER